MGLLRWLFLFRTLVRVEEDVLPIVKVMAIVAMVGAIGMIYEHVRGENLFAFLGGIRPVPEIGRVVFARRHSSVMHSWPGPSEAPSSSKWYGYGSEGGNGLSP